MDGQPPPPVGPGEGDPPERTSGLTIETCYRHPRVVTGVHCTRCGRPICPDCMFPAPVGYQCPHCVAQARGPLLQRGRVGARALVRRPGWVTSTLLAVNVGMFVVEMATGATGALFGSGNPLRLFDLGALYGPAVAQGQYWRLFTAMFLHAGLLHIAFNMYALYLFGYLVENTLGSARFALIYLVGGLLASVTSYVFGDPRVPAVGASGALFALLGAWVSYNFRRRGTALASANLRWALMIIALNLFLGLSIPNIDNSAHLGGLVAGVAAGWLAEGVGPRPLRLLIQVVGFAGLVGLAVALTLLRTAALR